MALFRRRARSVTPAGRRATSAVEDRIAAIRAARGAGAPLTVDQLPICQGLANLHADMISSFPLYACDELGMRVETPDILLQPDPSEPLGETLHTIVQSMWWTGNAVAVTDGTPATALRVQNPNMVTVAPSMDPYDDRRIDGWYIHGRHIDPGSVALWKINDDPRRGPLGESPLRRCWQAVENYAWAYRYLHDFFASGGNPSLLLKDKNASDPGQADELWAQWVAARQAGRPGIIPFDMELVAPPATNDISETVAVLEFCTAEICRATNTPPSIGNAPVAAALTYATTLEELRRWLVLSLRPTWMNRLERGFTALLEPGLVARFDTTELPSLDVFGVAPAGVGPASAQPATAPMTGPARLEIVA